MEMWPNLTMQMTPNSRKKDLQNSIFSLIYWFLYYFFLKKIEEAKKRKKNSNSRFARVLFFWARAKILSLPFRGKARLMVTLNT